MIGQGELAGPCIVSLSAISKSAPARRSTPLTLWCLARSWLRLTECGPQQQRRCPRGRVLREVQQALPGNAAGAPEVPIPVVVVTAVRGAVSETGRHVTALLRGHANL